VCVCVRACVCACVCVCVIQHSCILGTDDSFTASSWLGCGRQMIISNNFIDLVVHVKITSRRGSMRHLTKGLVENTNIAGYVDIINF
jgi:hypothetical protein